VLREVATPQVAGRNSRPTTGANVANQQKEPCGDRQFRVTGVNHFDETRVCKGDAA